jgi:predicted nucleic acid-binding protein
MWRSVGFDETDQALATCPITQGTLLRFLMREGSSAVEAVGVLDAFRSQPWHRFWPDELPYRLDDLHGVIGHRQVTGAYLVALARAHDAAVVTLDRGLAALHPDHTLLLRA